jgi:hypothetical protein
MHGRRGQHEGEGEKKRDYAAREKACGLGTEGDRYIAEKNK